MYVHPATQENIFKLIDRGAFIAGPAEGHLASGQSGQGRILETSELLGHIRLVLGHQGPLATKKIIVTAGGNQEPLDPVRVLTNRSSGKQGYALAQAAIDVGADVCLISTVSLTPPVGARVVEVRTVQEMLEAVLAEVASADALIMAAAGADFRPKKAANSKLKKKDGIPQIELEAAPDILETVAGLASGKKRLKVVVGFAAESQDLLENAAIKLQSKKLDIIAANATSDTQGGIQVWLGDGKGTWPLESGPTVTGTFMDVVLADFDQDGLLDLAGAGWGSYGALKVWLGDGTGGRRHYR